MNEEMLRRQRALETAIEEAQTRGKEPFDFERFRQFYEPGAPGEINPTELKYEYYVLYKEAMTMQQLARLQESYDECQGGDLRWD